jgi:hypothetical protein
MKQKIPTATLDECRFREHAVRHLSGELVDPDFAAHFPHCPACQEVEAVWRRLALLPVVEPRADLTRDILTAVQRSREKVVRPQWHRWAAAALLLFGVTGLSVWQLRESPLTPGAQAVSTTTSPMHAADSRREALDWFCRAQETDGSWSPARWGGDPRFEVALTALPMLAILSAPDEMTPSRAAAIEKSKRYLISHCDDKGRFGPAFYGSSYSQGIATLALLSSYQQQPDAETKVVLHRAIDVIISQQQATGCWGPGAAGQPDVTVTLWQVEALKAAHALGWEEVRPHLSLGNKWLAQHGSAAVPTLEALRAGGAVDYFAVYFATTQLKEAGDVSALDQLSSIRHALLRKQVQQGAESGSWTPDDRWATAGGRLYTTAMVSLALR